MNQKKQHFPSLKYENIKTIKKDQIMFANEAQIVVSNFPVPRKNISSLNKPNVRQNSLQITQNFGPQFQQINLQNHQYQFIFQSPQTNQIRASKISQLPMMNNQASQVNQQYMVQNLSPNQVKKNFPQLGNKQNVNQLEHNLPLSAINKNRKISKVSQQYNSQERDGIHQAGQIHQAHNFSSSQNFQNGIYSRFSQISPQNMPKSNVVADQNRVYLSDKKRHSKFNAVSPSQQPVNQHFSDYQVQEQKVDHVLQYNTETKFRKKLQPIQNHSNLRVQDHIEKKSNTQKTKKEEYKEILLSQSDDENEKKKIKKEDFKKKDKNGISMLMRQAIEKKYEILELLGKGSYGYVSKGKCKTSGRQVALKVMEAQTNTEYDKIKLLREIMIMKKVQNLCKRLEIEETKNQNAKGSLFTPELIDIITPYSMKVKELTAPDSSSSNSVQFKEGQKNDFQTLSNNSSDVNQNSLCLVIDYVDTDLDQILKHQIEFSEMHLLKIVYTSLCAIGFLHEANIMHRDIKSANILVQQDCVAKICDFGLARTLPQACTDDQSVNHLSLRYQFLTQNQKDRKNNINMDFMKQQENQISKFLVIDRQRRKKLKRYMSIHVGSRWYRAPEVSLVEKQYDQAADMWSFGCIIHEILQYVVKDPDESTKAFQKKRYLFQGNSCFPLSPYKPKEEDMKNGKQGNIVGSQDQMTVILQIIGKQNENDLSYLTGAHAINYVQELEQQNESSQKLNKIEQKQINTNQISSFSDQCNDLSLKISTGHQDIIEIMKNLLNFNPYFRMTAYECLKQKIFDSVREPLKEKIISRLRDENIQSYNRVGTYQPRRMLKSKINVNQFSPIQNWERSPQSYKIKSSNILMNEQIFSKVNMDDFQINGKLGKYAIELEIDSNEAFDYENPDNAKYTVDDLQTMLLKEIRSIEI